MASCEFAGGIKNVRGTISKHIIKKGQQAYVTSVVAKVTSSGKQRIYIQQRPVRTKPAGEKELKARTLFAEIIGRVKDLPDEQKELYAKEMKSSKGKFNGKKYATLRGYIVARLYAEEKAKLANIGGNMGETCD